MQSWLLVRVERQELLQVRSSPTVCTRALDTRVEEAQPEAAPPSNGKDQSEAGGEYEVRTGSGSSCMAAGQHLSLTQRSFVLLQISVKKPLGFQLARGIDGGAYVQRSDPSTGNTDDRIQVFILSWRTANRRH